MRGQYLGQPARLLLADQEIQITALKGQRPGDDHVLVERLIDGRHDRVGVQQPFSKHDFPSLPREVSLAASRGEPRESEHSVSSREWWTDLEPGPLALRCLTRAPLVTAQGDRSG